MNKEEIKHRERLKILENTMGTTFYKTGHLHSVISDAMENFIFSFEKIIKERKQISTTYEIIMVHKDDTKKKTQSLNLAMTSLKNEIIKGFYIVQGDDDFFEIELNDKGNSFINAWETKKRN